MSAYCGLDVGFGQVKGCSMNGGTELVTTCFPRVFALAPKETYGLQTFPTFSIDGKNYYIGQDAIRSRNYTRREDRDYADDPKYWLAIGKSMIDMKMLSKDQRNILVDCMVLGMAPGHMTADNKKKVRAKAREGIEFMMDGKIFSYKAKKARVIPQGAGAFFSWIFDDKGLPLADRIKGLRGVIDFGYRTTDFLMFDDLSYVGDQIGQSSEDTGIRNILKQLQDQVKQNYGAYEIEELLGILRGESLPYKGDDIDLTEIIAAMVKSHVQTLIQPEALKRWDQHFVKMREILICGGGKYLIEKFYPEFLEKYRKQLVYLDESSNAVGFYRYAKMLSRTQ